MEVIFLYLFTSLRKPYNMVGDEHNLVNNATTSAFRKLTFTRAVDRNVNRKMQIYVCKMELMYVPTVKKLITAVIKKPQTVY